MDSPNFCGQSCHVMAPQWAAYQVSPHSHVDCVQCHVGSGMKSYVQAKVNGTKQLIEVTFHTWPTPIHAPLNELRPARATCEACHSPTRFIGEKLLVKTTFGDDEKNSMTRTVLVLHLGGVDSVSHLSGIHGHHLNNFEYVATDNRRKPSSPSARPIRTAPRPIRELRLEGPNPGRAPHHGLHGLPQPGHPRLPDCGRRHRRSDAQRQPQPQPSLHAQGSPAADSGRHTPPRPKPARRSPPASTTSTARSIPTVWSAQRAKIDASARRLVAIYDRNVFPSHEGHVGHVSQ